MPRFQDLLFALFAVVLAALLAFEFSVGIVALVGAFVCGSLYVFAGMVPSRDEPFGRRVLNSGFLAVIVSTLVMILPATLGVDRHKVETVIVVTAVLLPVAALAFEIVRTPRVLAAIRRSLGSREAWDD